MELEQLVEKARQSTLFCAPVSGPDLERFLNQEGDRIRQMANQALNEGIEHIYWVGAGNSWVNLFPGKYLLDKYTNIPSDVYTSYEFTWRNPKRLNRKSWVFLSSYSGATEDTLIALRHANREKAYTIALVNKAESPMGVEASKTIAYNSKDLYLLPMAGAYLFALEAARLSGAEGVDEIVQGLEALPSLLKRQYIEEELPSRKLAEEFVDERLIYTLGCGPLYGLAYKFGLTVFMENMRIHGSFIETTEFRHGPVEIFDKEKPAIVVLMGTDESRALVERVCKVCEARGAHLLIFDAQKYPNVHPMLTPFALTIPLQWFAVWSTLMRGITDLDDRVLMGRGLLGRGQGVTWP